MATAYPGALDDFVPYIANVGYYSANDLNNIRLAVIALETALGYGATVPTVNNTALTLVKRDASGNFSAGTGNFSTGIASARSGGSAVFAMDVQGFGSQLTIANAATATPFGASANFSGLFMVNDTATDGRCALFMKGDAIVKVAETTANTYTTTQSTASRVNVYLNSNVVTIENLWGSSRTLTVMAIRTRGS